MLHYLTINTTVEITCLLAAFFCLKKDASLVWRSMILFLFITCVAEMTGIYVKRLYLADRVHIHPNAWVYNILLFFQAGFFSLMFLYLLKKFTNSKPIIIIGLALLTGLHIYKIFVNGIYIYDDLTNTLMSVLLIFYSFYFYYSLINDETYISLKNSPAFWWVSGVLFFYFGSTVCNIFYEKFAPLVINPKQGFNYFKYLFYAFNILLYSCWTYSLICRKWLTKR